MMGVFMFASVPRLLFSSNTNCFNFLWGKFMFRFNINFKSQAGIPFHIRLTHLSFSIPIYLFALSCPLSSLRGGQDIRAQEQELPRVPRGRPPQPRRREAEEGGGLRGRRADRLGRAGRPQRAGGLGGRGAGGEAEADRAADSGGGGKGGGGCGYGGCQQGRRNR